MSDPYKFIKTVPKEPFPGAKAAAFALTSTNPRDFDSKPVYLVSQTSLQGADAVPNLAPSDTVDGGADGWAAYTSLRLSAKLKSHLTMHNAWIGEGFAAVWDDHAVKENYGGLSLSRNFAIGFASLVHEAAHHIELGCPCATDAADIDGITHPIFRDPHFESYRVGFHGPQFVRAALHLQHRVNRSRHYDVDLDDMIIAGPRYRMSPASDYLIALESELHERENEPIWFTLLRQPPSLFTEIWLMDIENRRKAFTG